MVPARRVTETEGKSGFLIFLAIVGAMFLYFYLEKHSHRAGDRCGQGIEEEEWRLFTWQYDREKKDLVCRDAYGLKPFYHAGWQREHTPIPAPNLPDE